MKKLVVSTGNKDKLRELKTILEDFDIEVLSKDEVGLGNLEVEEDKETLEENAEKKARAIFERHKAIVLADDTGLFVDALNGGPGVFTARYAGENCNYEDNRKKLLAALKDKEDRKANFTTVIALIDEKGTCHIRKGICKGLISKEERGDKGFGYDRIFIPEGDTRTFAEMTEREKNSYSHRGKALASLKDLLKEVLA